MNLIGRAVMGNRQRNEITGYRYSKNAAAYYKPYEIGFRTLYCGKRCEHSCRDNCRN